MAAESEQSFDSDVVKHVYEDIFNNTITDFMRKNQVRSGNPSEIIRIGEKKWNKLSKKKKADCVMKTLQCDGDGLQNNPKRRADVSSTKEDQNIMQENMDSELILSDSVENALMVEGCCPPKKRRKPSCPKKRRKPNPCCPKKRRKPKCPRKKRKSCPKKRKPSCRKKRKPSCPRKKKKC